MAGDGYIIDDPSHAPQRRPLAHRLILLAAIATGSLLAAIAFLADGDLFDRTGKATGRESERIGVLRPAPVGNAPAVAVIEPPHPVTVTVQGTGGAPGAGAAAGSGD